MPPTGSKIEQLGKWIRLKYSVSSLPLMKRVHWHEVKFGATTLLRVFAVPHQADPNSLMAHTKATGRPNKSPIPSKCRGLLSPSPCSEILLKASPIILIMT